MDQTRNVSISKEAMNVSVMSALFPSSVLAWMSTNVRNIPVTNSPNVRILLVLTSVDVNRALLVPVIVVSILTNVDGVFMDVISKHLVITCLEGTVVHVTSDSRETDTPVQMSTNVQNNRVGKTHSAKILRGHSCVR